MRESEVATYVLDTAEDLSSAGLERAKTWPRPTFPLNGRHVMLAGVPEGPLIGRILEEVEECLAGHLLHYRVE